MTIALPITTAEEVATADDRHYTVWQPRPRPAVVINGEEFVGLEDPGTVDPHEHYTEWTPKPRP